MEILVGLVIVGLVFFFAEQRKKLRSSAQVSKRAVNSKSAQKQLRIWQENEKWPYERWQEASNEQAAGKPPSKVPDWFFDAATEAQLDRLQRMGTGISGSKQPTKGQASDIIGLFSPVESGTDEMV